uniref:CRAL-TRIO domain-containing protein n=1 Tax=Acrobeloides nanus TaxID=290746 RepID=A0A914C5Y9_9BILA
MVKDDLTPYYDTSFNFLRWIQGYNGNLKEAARKLRIHLKMRKSHWELDNFVEKPRTHAIHKHWTYGITGKSNVLENVIVNIDQSGNVDYHGMLQVYSVQEVMKARVKDMEDMLAQCMKLEEETGKQAWILYVMDLTGLKFDKNLYNLVTGAMRSLSEFMAEHYVELIKYFVLVNVPSFVFYLWTMVKPVLPDRTRQKVRILSSSNWRDEILDFASYEALPTKWNTEKFDQFHANLDIPIPFPETEYYCNRTVELPIGIEKSKIATGKTLFLSKELKAGDALQWWISGDAEFGLGVFYSKNRDENNTENMQTIYPCLEWMPGPTIAPLNDQIVAKTDGFYRIWISNSRAWWHTLTILSKLTIIPGEGNDCASTSSIE